jgi:SMI1 / KNR4 family (SUKH-1)
VFGGRGGVTSVNVLDQIGDKLRALREWFAATRPSPDGSGYGIAHGFVTADPMPEAEVRAVEVEFGVSLPPEYRAFLRRFGDGEVGPGWFHPVRLGLTAASRHPFPLAQPFLGCESPAYRALPTADEQGEYRRLQAEWESVPKDDGVLFICDYGCAMYGQLILNGPFGGQVWVLAGDAAYYGPFGGSEGHHDEDFAGQGGPTWSPRDYTFFEWYESWLDGHLKLAGLMGH